MSHVINTARRLDVSCARDGKLFLRRTHGGVVSLRVYPSRCSSRFRKPTNVEAAQKTTLGVAATLVQPGQSVLVDTGTGLSLCVRLMRGAR